MSGGWGAEYIVLIPSMYWDDNIHTYIHMHTTYIHTFSAYILSVHIVNTQVCTEKTVVKLTPTNTTVVCTARMHAENVCVCSMRMRMRIACMCVCSMST
jgi:hypothetical protein